VTVRVAAEVREAITLGQGVVALETAVLTHGLPRTPMTAPPCVRELVGGDHRWDDAAPANLELARAMAAVVRNHGAMPATVGMLDGELIIGLTDAELVRLGNERGAVKLSSRDLAAAHALRDCGGTTVAGTLAAIALANASLSHEDRGSRRDPIRVFATGGIGGVHRGWTVQPDVSADLLALAKTPACVVSAGAKSILDLPATVEALDTLGVPVLGLATPWFPRFLTEGAAPLAVQREVPSIAIAARVCHAHWGTFASTTGILLANPPPARFALELDEVESIIAESVAEAVARGVTSAGVTPFLLARVAERTGGRSVHANVAALLNNGRVAALLAAAILP
jgi:pseudouridine-5'-phosphate glycosidase